MRLLKVNDDLTLEILPETLLIPEFKAVIRRIKKCKEDSDGRDKLIAKKELSEWLAERQLPCGGLNGRPEKKEDVQLTKIKY